MKRLLSLAALVLAPLAVRADTLYSQASNGSATTLTTSYFAPDGSAWDEFVWDGFLLPTAANITEIRWRGGYGGPLPGGSQNVLDFEVSIYGSIPGGSQPDLNARLVHHVLTDRGLPGNAGETFAGTFGGLNLYDYGLVLPNAFLAAGNTRYWVQIIAWQPGYPNWGLAAASGGNGSHFAQVPAVTGDFRFIMAAGDGAFSIIGTPADCAVPVITQNPLPTSVCYMGTLAYFNAAATGTGPLTYQWRHNGAAMHDGYYGGATFAGTQTPNLSIAQPSYWADVGIYDCVVTNSCGFATTAGALLVVSQGPPAILSNPSPTSTCPGGTAVFSITSAGAGTTWWRKNWGGPLQDGVTPSGSIISGAATDTLTITNVQPGDVAVYGCSRSNGCQVNSTGATLIICYADYNCDGFVDGLDYDLFNNDFESPDPVQQMIADYNHDGFVDGIDYDLFNNDFESGC